MDDPKQPQNDPAQPIGDPRAALEPTDPAQETEDASPDITALLGKPPRRFTVTHVLLLTNTTILALLIGVAIRPYLVPAGPTSTGTSVEAESAKEPEEPATPSQPPAHREITGGQAASATQRPRVDEPPVPRAKTGKAAPAEKGLSWARAEEAFHNGDYVTALGLYADLRKLAETTPSNRLVRDFFVLRAATCQENLGRLGEAQELFLEITESGSPILRAVAGYHAALNHLALNEPLPARARAYQALAALGAVEKPTSLDAACDFLVAHAMTQKALSLCTGATAIPRHLPAVEDPLAGLDEAALRRLLALGAAELGQATLGPQVQPAPADHGIRRWLVACIQAPVEEVCARISAETGLNVRWENVDKGARNRPVTLYLPALAEQRAVEVACGSVGLLARFTGEEAIVYDPQNFRSTAEQRDLQGREAISTWRRFFMRYPEDSRAAEAHFAVATLYGQTGDALNGMAEYRLVAQKYPQESLAALARLHCARLQISLRDYAGARDELLDLLNRYPNCPAIDEVYLRLAHATMETGNLDEAAATFRKLYYLDLSEASRLGSALGCGEAMYRKGKYEDAVQWLTRYLAESKSPPTDDVAQACFLLAKSEAGLGHMPQTASALQRALAAKPGRPHRLEMLTDLARAHFQLGQYVAALSALDRTLQEDPPPAQSDEIALLRAEVLRAMGLPERATAVLSHRVVGASSPTMQARMNRELARCYLETGDAAQARKLLADALPKMAPGPLAHETAVDLAAACVQSNVPLQAVAVCRELLKAPCAEPVRKRAMEVLGSAYAQQGDYERAALALSGKVPETQGGANP
jgi:tetratricopeptide (TPR) repeat protein